MPLFAWIMSQYGAAMLQVQTFEATLANFVGVIEADAKVRDPAGQQPASLERALRPVIKRSWHLLQRASASEMRRRVEGKIDEQLLTDISTMIGWRDFLAHRYLRVRLFPSGGSDPQPTPQIAAELLEIGQAFGELTKRVGAAATAVIAGWPKREAPVGVDEALARMVRELLAVQPQRFARGTAAPGSDPEAEGESPEPDPPPAEGSDV